MNRAPAPGAHMRIPPAQAGSRARGGKVDSEVSDVVLSKTFTYDFHCPFAQVCPNQTLVLRTSSSDMPSGGGTQYRLHAGWETPSPMHTSDSEETEANKQHYQFLLLWVQFRWRRFVRKRRNRRLARLAWLILRRRSFDMEMIAIILGYLLDWPLVRLAALAQSQDRLHRRLGSAMKSRIMRNNEENEGNVEKRR